MSVPRCPVVFGTMPRCLAPHSTVLTSACLILPPNKYTACKNYNTLADESLYVPESIDKVESLEENNTSEGTTCPGGEMVKEATILCSDAADSDTCIFPKDAAKRTAENAHLCTFTHVDSCDNTKGASHTKDPSFYSNKGDNPCR